MTKEQFAGSLKPFRNGMMQRRESATPHVCKSSSFNGKHVRRKRQHGCRLTAQVVLHASPLIIGPGRCARITLASLLPRFAPKLTSSQAMTNKTFRDLMIPVASAEDLLSTVSRHWR